jgi:ubiquinone/menaquinone biosynthesis C-methylase UbiE
MTLERVDIEACADPLQIVLHRARYDFVLARLPPGQQVLEIGTGPGTFTRELWPKCAGYVGVEYDAATCEEARRKTEHRAEILQGDARCLPLADNRFSFIVCLEVLEHLGDWRAGVGHIHRCLQPGGMGVISVPWRRTGARSETNEFHLYEPGEAELVAEFRRLFARVEVFYQYFEESPGMTLARRLHLRRILGWHQIYADLSAGRPHAIARLRIDQKARGLKNTLLIVASGKK